MTLSIVNPFVTENIDSSFVWTVLFAVLFIGGAMLVSTLLLRVMQEKNFRVYPTVQMILTGLLSLALYLRFGIQLIALQGLILFFILLYASCSDLTTHTMDDSLWVMVAILGIVSAEFVGWSSMLLGLLMILIPQILISFIPPHKALGGADIKLSAALAFLLGWQKGLLGFILGLLFAVVTMAVVQKENPKKKKQPFALIPFLSVAAMLIFLI